jgi:hypothetical protein
MLNYSLFTTRISGKKKINKTKQTEERKEASTTRFRIPQPQLTVNK